MEIIEIILVPCERPAAKDAAGSVLQWIPLKVCHAQCETLSCQWFKGAGEVADLEVSG